MHQACVDPDDLIDPIRLDVLYYAKATEVFAKISSRPYLLHLCERKFQDTFYPEESRSEYPLVPGYVWLLQRPEMSSMIGEDILSLHPSVEELSALAGGRDIFSAESDVLLYLAVGAELLIFIDECPAPTTVPVLQLATFVPNFVNELSNPVTRMENFVSRFPPRKPIEWAHDYGGVFRFMGGVISPYDDAESTLGSILVNNTAHSPNDWEREEMAKHVFLRCSGDVFPEPRIAIANGFMRTADNGHIWSFILYCILNSSPSMLRIFLEHGATVRNSKWEYYDVMNLAFYRNDIEIFKVLEEFGIDLYQEIREPWRVHFKDRDTASGLDFLVWSSVFIGTTPSVAKYGPPPPLRLLRSLEEVITEIRSSTTQRRRENRIDFS